MKNTFFAGAVSALSLVSCATLSSFGSTDADDDGRISRDEATRSPELSAAFGSADADQDGYLNSAEFERARDLVRLLNGSPHDTPEAGGSHQH